MSVALAGKAIFKKKKYGRGRISFVVKGYKAI
jgi:hypothetical protein